MEDRGKSLSWNGSSMNFACRHLVRFLNSYHTHAESDNIHSVPLIIQCFVYEIILSTIAPAYAILALYPFLDQSIRAKATEFDEQSTFR